MELLCNDYLKSSGTGRTWHVDIGRCQRQPKSYFEEVCTTIQHITSDKQQEVNLLFSGGLDSTFVMNVLIHLGIEFKTNILRLNDDLNYEDVTAALALCEQHKIKPNIIDLDVEWFCSSGKLEEICLKANGYSFVISFTFWLASQVKGIVIAGGDPPMIKNKGGLFYLEEKQISHSELNFWKNEQLAGTPFTLQYSAESMLAFLKHPFVQSFINSTSDNIDHDSFSATDLCKLHVFNDQPYFELKYRVKQHGYEYLLMTDPKPLLNKSISDFGHRFRMTNGSCLIPIDQAIEKLTPV